MNESLSEEARRALREMGLTEYETRIYLSLLDIGAATASRISEDANVPYSKIYEALNSLEQKGWIETQSSRPRRYYPKSPTEALEAAKLRLESMMKTWERSVLNELQLLYDKMEIREKPDIWILRGEFNTITKLREMMENTRIELMIAAPPLATPFMNVLIPMLRKSVDSGVDLLVMFSRNIRDDLVKEISKISRVRVRDHMFGGGVIADGREALLLLGEDKPSLIIWSDHTGLVKFAKDYFQHLWNTAYEA